MLFLMCNKRIVKMRLSCDSKDPKMLFPGHTVDTFECVVYQTMLWNDIIAASFAYVSHLLNLLLAGSTPERDPKHDRSSNW